MMLHTDSHSHTHKRAAGTDTSIAVGQAWEVSISGCIRVSSRPRKNGGNGGKWGEMGYFYKYILENV